MVQCPGCGTGGRARCWAHVISWPDRQRSGGQSAADAETRQSAHRGCTRLCRPYISLSCSLQKTAASLLPATAWAFKPAQAGGARGSKQIWRCLNETRCVRIVWLHMRCRKPQEAAIAEAASSATELAAAPQAGMEAGLYPMGKRCPAKQNSLGVERSHKIGSFQISQAGHSALLSRPFSHI